MMRSHFWPGLLAIVVSLSTGVNAQSNGTVTVLDTTSLPPCALKCQSVLKAESSCQPTTPSAVVQTNQTVYHDCFCYSSFLNRFANSPDGVCDEECPLEADREKTQTWYIGYCKADTANIPSSKTPTSTSTSASQTAPAAAATTSASSSPPRRKNGLSKKATIGIAVGVSVGVIIIAVAIYFPVSHAAGKARKKGTPAPGDVGEQEKGVDRQDVNRQDPKDGPLVGQVHVITAYNQ